MPSSQADPYVRVLLVESDKDTVSILKLCLSEIKECRLLVAPTIARALVQIEQEQPNLILYSHDAEDADAIRTLSAIHQKHPFVYLLASLPEPNDDLMANYMRAGANDCIVKDRNYIPELMMSVMAFT